MDEKVVWSAGGVIIENNKYYLQKKENYFAYKV